MNHHCKRPDIAPMCSSCDEAEYCDAYNCPEPLIEYSAYCDKIKQLEQENAELKTVLTELMESAEYWSEYDVPVGIIDRIKKALQV